MAAKKPQSVPCANVCGPDINSGIKDTDLIYFLLPLSISWQNAAAVRWRFNVQCARNLKLARQCVTYSRHHEIESARLGARLGSPVISRAPLAPATVKRARHPPSLAPPSCTPSPAQPHPWAWVAQNRGSLLWLITFLRCRQWHDMIFFVFCFSHFFCLLFFDVLSSSISMSRFLFFPLPWPMLMFTVRGQNDFLCHQNDAVLLRPGQIRFTFSFFLHASRFSFLNH